MALRNPSEEIKAPPHHPGALRAGGSMPQRRSHQARLRSALESTHCVPACSHIRIRECPLGNVGLLLRQVFHGMVFTPLVLLCILVNVTCLRACHAVERGDGSTAEPRECSENSPLLLSYLCALDLVNHSIRLADACLCQLLRCVFASEGLQVAVRHVHVNVHWVATAGIIHVCFFSALSSSAFSLAPPLPPPPLAPSLPSSPSLPS